MKRINSKQKGNRFELAVAHLLTKLTGVKWFRVGISSGARATREGIQDNRYRGDVFCETAGFKQICIECKITGEVLKLADFLREKSPLWAWWKQTVQESGKVNKPILIFQYRRGPIMAMSREFLPTMNINASGSVRMHDLNGEVIYLSVLK